MLPCYNPRDHFTPTHSPRPQYADLLHSRGTGEPTAPTYSSTFTDAATSYSQQPCGDEQCSSAEEPKDIANAEKPRQIMTRAMRSQKNAEKELSKIDAEIERLNKRKAKLGSNTNDKKRKCC
jgi:hypothetical protein